MVRGVGQISPLQSVHVNPLKAELIPICHLLPLLGARHILHVSGLRIKDLHFPIQFNIIYICLSVPERGHGPQNMEHVNSM
jgi:hypothetical protein